MYDLDKATAILDFAHAKLKEMGGRDIVAFVTNGEGQKSLHSFRRAEDPHIMAAAVVSTMRDIRKVNTKAAVVLLTGILEEILSEEGGENG